MSRMSQKKLSAKSAVVFPSCSTKADGSKLDSPLASQGDLWHLQPIEKPVDAYIRGYMNPHPSHRRFFTLIELLVVVAIIAILMSMIMPAFRHAVEMAGRAACLSNLHQSVTAATTYAEDSNDFLAPGCPSEGTEASCYYMQGWYDLIAYLKPVVNDFRIWSCPALRAVPIDSPANTRAWKFGTYFYFAGRTLPDFGGKAPVPDRMNRANSDWVLMQDRSDRSNWWGYYRANHGYGTFEVAPVAENNPAHVYKVGYEPPFGANLTFFDGHGRWFEQEDLVNAGPQSWGDPSPIFSVLPR